MVDLARIVACSGGDALPDLSDEFREKLVPYGPAMFMEAGKEVAAKRDALVGANGRGSSISRRHAWWIWGKLCSENVLAIFLGFLQDPRAFVAPVGITLNQGADLTQVEA